MKIKILLLLLLLTSLQGFSDNNKIDSLKQLIANGEEDTNMVNHHIELSRLFRKKLDDTALVHLQNGLELSKKIDFFNGMALIYIAKGVIYTDMQKYEDAFKSFDLASEIIKKIRNSRLSILLNKNLSYLLIKIGDYKKAELNILESEILARELKDSVLILEMLSLNGNYLNQIGYHERVIKIQKEALSIARGIKRFDYIKYSLNNIGSSNLKMNQFDSSLYYYLQALKISFEYNLNPASVYTNIGTYFDRKLEIDSSEKYFLLAENHNNSKNSIPAYNLSQIFIRKNNLIEGLKYAKIALEYSKQGNLLDYADANKSIANIYLDIGDTKNSSKYYREYITLKDSIFDRETVSEILKLEARYENDKKEQQIASLQTENTLKDNILQKNRLLLWSLAGGGVLFLFASLLLFRQNRIKKKNNALLEEKNSIIQEQKENAELKAMLAQMNPHFISNFLNSMYASVSNKDWDEKKLQAYILKFGKLSRLILEYSNKLEITLEEELHVLELYLDLEQMKTQNIFSYDIDIDPAIDMHNTLVPPMIFQPFLENAIWHGIVPRKENGTILLKIKKQEDSLHCIIEDNGIGIQQSTLEKSSDNVLTQKSYALTFTAERLKILWNRKKKDFILNMQDLQSIDVSKTGTRVTFDLPLFI